MLNYNPYGYFDKKINEGKSGKSEQDKMIYDLVSGKLRDSSRISRNNAIKGYKKNSTDKKINDLYKKYKTNVENDEKLKEQKAKYGIGEGLQLSTNITNAEDEDQKKKLKDQQIAQQLGQNPFSPLKTLLGQ